MNKRGYTLIEVLIAVVITLSVVYGAIIIPVNVAEDYQEYQELIDETMDLNVLRTALVNDLEGAEVIKVDNQTLKIGDSTYTFADQWVQKETNGSVTNISDEKYVFNITDGILHIYNNKTSLKYNTKTVLDRGV